MAVSFETNAAMNASVADTTEPADAERCRVDLQARISAAELIAFAAGFWKLLLILPLLAACITFYLSSLGPDEFESFAVIDVPVQEAHSILMPDILQNVSREMQVNIEADQQRSYAPEKLYKKISITPVTLDSTLLGFRGSSPESAKRLADAVIDVYSQPAALTAQGRDQIRKSFKYYTIIYDLYRNARVKQRTLLDFIRQHGWAGYSTEMFRVYQLIEMRAGWLRDWVLDSQLALYNVPRVRVVEGPSYPSEPRQTTARQFVNAALAGVAASMALWSMLYLFLRNRKRSGSADK